MSFRGGKNNNSVSEHKLHAHNLLTPLSKTIRIGERELIVRTFRS